MSRRIEAQIWPVGQAAHGALVLRASTVGALAATIAYHGKSRGWLGMDLWVHSLGTPRRAWKFQADTAKLRRLR